MAAIKLINRQNYEEINEFLDYQKRIRGVDGGTLHTYWNCLLRVLTWAWEKELRGAGTIRPGLVEYLEAATVKGGGKISAQYFGQICSVARLFFQYQRERHRNAYARVSIDWVESLHPPKLRSDQAVVKKRDIYTLEDTVRLATFPTTKLVHQRIQAAAAFLFLTGMRIGAFMSLPIGCVDLKGMRVSQLPQRGVHTKNSKAAITTILPVEELLGVVRAWDERIRGEMGEEFLWFPNLDNYDPSKFSPRSPQDKDRRTRFYCDLHELCAMTGVRYLSPHKFRHGHAVFGLKRSRNMQEWKAVSQNLMHSSTGITDTIYGVLVADDQHETMMEIGRKDEKDMGDRPGMEIDYDRLAESIARRMKG